MYLFIAPPIGFVNQQTSVSHNHTLFSTLKCVQVGDPSFACYMTLYKMIPSFACYMTLYKMIPSQQDSSQTTIRLAKTILRRMVHMQEEVKQGLRCNKQQNSHKKELRRMLIKPNTCSIDGKKKLNAAPIKYVTLYTAKTTTYNTYDITIHEEQSKRTLHTHVTLWGEPSLFITI